MYSTVNSLHNYEEFNFGLGILRMKAPPCDRVLVGLLYDDNTGMY
jgi:hypothetical protein